MPAKLADVDEYIAGFPEDVRDILQRVRTTIHTVVPDVGEKISYQIPTITSGGSAVVYFSGWKRHIGIYPAPAVDDDLEAELAPYRSAKATLKFPLREPIPYDLIQRFVAALVELYVPEAH